MITLDDIARNKGLQHIVAKVLGNLDPRNLVKCRALSTQFKNLIDNSKYLMLLQIKHAFLVRNQKLQKLICHKDLKVIRGHKITSKDLQHCTESSRHALKALERSFGKIDKTSCETLLYFMKNFWCYPFYHIGRKLLTMDILQYAIACNLVKIVEILLTYSIAISKKSMDMKIFYYEKFGPVKKRGPLYKKLATSFSWACRNGQLEIVQLLLEYHKKEKIIQFNSSGGPWPGPSEFSLACEYGKTEVVKALLHFSIEYGEDIDLNAVYMRETALHLACRKGHLETASAILQHHIDYGGIDMNYVGQFGSTPFVHACFYPGMLPVVKTLLKLAKENHGINLNRRYKGIFPLHYACTYGGTEIVKALLDSRIFDVNAQSSSGKTALWMACDQNKIDMVKLLLETPDIERDIPDNMARTPLDRAIFLNLDEIVKLLKNNVLFTVQS